MIHTKLHELRTTLADPRYRASSPQAHSIGDGLSASLNGIPHLVITDELRASLNQEQAMRTVEALFKADQLHLPYEDCLVESTVKLATKDGRDTARGFFVFHDYKDGWVGGYAAFLMHDGSIMGLHKPVDIKLIPSKEDPAFAFEFEVRGGKEVSRAAAGWVLSMLSYLYTLTYTRGVTREHVTPNDLAKLNKARSSRGKAEIPPYTVYRIGKVYDAHGQGSTWHPGTKMRPHLRAGHVRNQCCGAGRKDHKLIFIEPILVNCESPTEITHRPRVIMP